MDNDHQTSHRKLKIETHESTKKNPVVSSCAHQLNIMKRKLHQWWSIPPISTKQTITSHLHSLNTKKWIRQTTLKIHDLTWNKHTIVVGLNRLMVVPPLPSIVLPLLSSSKQLISCLVLQSLCPAMIWIFSVLLFTRWILLILSKSCSSSNDRPLWLVLYVVLDTYFTAISVLSCRSILSLAEIRQST